ncbi:MAG: hypothetical protein J4F37_14075 [Acidobacteria bacterium]|nr:hypothetical protein [Acidobacteriota bacterium]
MAAAVRQRCSEPDISARSVLVTVLGDSVLPVTKTLWLSSLFQLAKPFGFSERLVRTSMFRLVAEGWMTNERIGRRSRASPRTPTAASTAPSRTPGTARGRSPSSTPRQCPLRSATGSSGTCAGTASWPWAGGSWPRRRSGRRACASSCIWCSRRPRCRSEDRNSTH